jgi:hypothetical protein
MKTFWCIFATMLTLAITVSSGVCAVETLDKRCGYIIIAFGVFIALIELLFICPKRSVKK